MKHLALIPLSVVAFLVACESGTSPDASVSTPKGELRYERHFERESSTTMKCNVYASEKTVTLDMKFSILNSSNTMTEKIEIKFGDPSKYNGDIRLSGLFLTSNKKLCSQMKNAAATMDNGVANCTDKGSTLKADLPSVSSSYTPQAIESMVEKLNLKCDELYDQFYKTSNEILEDMDDSTPPSADTEKALSCNVSKGDNSLQVNIVYPDKSVLLTATHVGDAFNIREEYTNVDSETLTKACASYKNEEELTGVSCEGSVISYAIVEPELDMATMSDYSEMVICPGVLSGNISFEDALFGD